MSPSNKHPLRFGFHRPDPSDVGYTFKLVGKNVYLLVCVTILIIGLASWTLVKFTPFVTWIGGSSTREEKVSREISLRITELQKRVEAQSRYILRLQQMVSTDGAELPVDTTTYNSTVSDNSKGEHIVNRIALDDSLRIRVRRSNLNLPNRTPAIFKKEESRNLEDEFLLPPIRGVVRNPFNLKRGHFGVDVIAPENSAIQCTLDGLVIESDWTLEGGNTIVVQHGYNLISVYKHNSALLKRKGEAVKAGEAIAIIGDTGLHSDGPHVHFELWYKGQPLDPEAYIVLDR